MCECVNVGGVGVWDVWDVCVCMCMCGVCVWTCAYDSACVYIVICVDVFECAWPLHAHM